MIGFKATIDFFFCSGAFSPSGDDVEFAAIKLIHNQLDDNSDGSVDFTESAEVCD